MKTYGEIEQRLLDAKNVIVSELNFRDVPANFNEGFLELASKVGNIQQGGAPFHLALQGGGGGGEGGRGSSYEGCGGAAGGLVVKENIPSEKRAYYIVIGDGGLGSPGGNVGFVGSSGSNSVFDYAIFALGGVGGNFVNGKGGCGSGCRGSGRRSYGTQYQGYDGGFSASTAFGGAPAGTGLSGGNYSGSNGFPVAISGYGRLVQIGDDLIRFGEGGGNSQGGLSPNGKSGNGGTPNVAGGNAPANSGGGGGGGCSVGGTAGGNGGSGVCYVWYLTGDLVATGGIIYQSGLYTVHKFIETGYFTVT